MDKEIKLKDRSAIIEAKDHYAVLSIQVLEVEKLLTSLADEIDLSPELEVREVGYFCDGDAYINIYYEIPESDLLQIVCDAISKIFETDITILGHA